MSDAQVVQAVGLRRDVGRRLGFANADELRVVDRVLQRLELGRDRYGHLDLAKPRNWRKERFEERLDALVYDVAEELSAEDAERDPLREDARHELLAWDARQGVARASSIVRALRDADDLEPYAEYELDDAEVP